MTSDRELLGRAMADVEVRSMGVEEFHRRRRRRRRTRRVRIAAAAIVVLVAVPVSLGTLRRDTDDSVTAEVPARNVREAIGELAPGRYFVDPDGDPSTPLRVSFDVVAGGWSRSAGAAKITPEGLLRLTITAAPPEAATGACGSGSADTAGDGTIEDLATALSDLGALEVTAGSSRVTIDGRRGVHLRLTVPDVYTGGEGSASEFLDCDTGALQPWIAPILNGAFHGYNGDVGRRIDLWLLDVDGTRLVLSTTASAAVDVSELDAMFDSVQIEP